MCLSASVGSWDQFVLVDGLLVWLRCCLRGSLLHTVVYSISESSGRHTPLLQRSGFTAYLVRVLITPRCGVFPVVSFREFAKWRQGTQRQRSRPRRIRGDRRRGFPAARVHSPGICSRQTFRVSTTLFHLFCGEKQENAFGKDVRESSGALHAVSS